MLNASRARRSVSEQPCCPVRPHLLHAADTPWASSHGCLLRRRCSPWRLSVARPCRPLLRGDPSWDWWRLHLATKKQHPYIRIYMHARQSAVALNISIIPTKQPLQQIHASSTIFVDDIRHTHAYVSTLSHCYSWSCVLLALENTRRSAEVDKRSTHVATSDAAKETTY